MRGGSGRRPGFGVVLAVVLVVSGACGRPAVVRGQRVDVSLHDFRIDTARAEVPSGTVTPVVHNRAPATHEFLVLRTDLGPDRLPIAADGLSVDEERVRNAGEVSDVRAGTIQTLSLSLPPGRYVLICNLEGHYLGGMHHSLIVGGASGATG